MYYTVPELDPAVTTCPAVITLQSIRVGTGTDDREGNLIFRDGELRAVVVRLEDPMHGELVGTWHLEAGFGAHDAGSVVFDDLDAAVEWVAGVKTTAK